MIDSVYRKDKNHYLQVFLEKLNILLKKKKIPEYITIDDSCDNSDSEDSDKENSD